VEKLFLVSIGKISTKIMHEVRILIHSQRAHCMTNSYFYVTKDRFKRNLRH